MEKIRQDCEKLIGIILYNDPTFGDNLKDFKTIGGFKQ